MTVRRRWRFLDPENPDEAEYQRRTLANIDAWWAEFDSYRDDLSALFSGERRWDLPSWMADTLQRIDPALMWEYGPAVNSDGHRLVITPESESALRPLVATILKRAPKFGAWEFYDCRLVESAVAARETVEARTGGKLEGVSVFVAQGEHHLVDLTFCGPNARGPADEGARREACIAAESLLGEHLLDRWIGTIDVMKTPNAEELGPPSSKPPGGEVSLADLKTRVESTISEIRSSLPEAPHLEWTPIATWSLLKLEPPEQDDYPEQDDLFVAKTPHLEMWRAAHSGFPFHDQRFSRLGERFAYVKLDGSEGVDEERFSDKGEIEDALDEILIPAGLGCQIGGGTGYRYSYIDLALTDLDEGIAAVCKRLREGNVPKRSWIQFFDGYLAHEWVGVYPDSPPPPMPE